MACDKEEQKKTALLCRIALTEEESERFLDDLAPLLMLAKDFEGVLTRDKEAAEQQAIAFMRNDEKKRCGQTESLLACAPKTKDGFILLSLKKEEETS